MIRSPVASLKPRLMAAPYPWVGSWTSRAFVLATSSLVPRAALLLTTMISSMTPDSKNSSIAFLIDSFSL
jgi:hypothetical protein